MPLSASQSLRHQGLVRRAAVYQAWVDAQCMRLADALAMLRADAQQVEVDFEPSDFVLHREVPALRGRGHGAVEAVRATRLGALHPF